MALRDLPYLPLYIQDYLTDEKLNLCSAATQGVYIKIMCVLHKSETYGGILLKQKDKQKSSSIENFALKFAKLLPFDYTTIYSALTELLDEKVMRADGDFIYQKRMVKDGRISEERSKAAKKGGGNPNLLKQKPKQSSKQKSEYENDNEDENEDEKQRGGVGEKISGHDLFPQIDKSPTYTLEDADQLETELQNNYSQHESLVRSVELDFQLRITTEDVRQLIPTFMRLMSDISKYPITLKEAKSFFGYWFKSKVKEHVSKQQNGTGGNRRRQNGGISDEFRNQLRRDLQAGIGEAVAKEA